MPDDTTGQRMRAARQRAKLSQGAVGKALAKAIGRKTPFSASAVGQWEGDQSEPSREVIVEFAELTRSDLNWLMTGVVQPPRPSVESIVGGVPRGGRVVPKLNPAQAVRMPIDYHAFDSVHTHFPCSRKSFSFDVFDKRNAPLFDVGHRVVIDPELTPIPGDMVLAAVGDEPVFAKYTRKAGKPPVVCLEPLNTDWDEIEVMPENGGRIIGVMTEHAVPRRQ